MLRLLALAAILAAVGCSDGGAPPSLDLSMAVSPDFAGAARQCGVDNVLQACGGSCAACLYVAGGICVTPCKTSGPSTCPSPQSCHHFDSSVDGGSGSVQLVGSCSNVDGYCA